MEDTHDSISEQSQFKTAILGTSWHQVGQISTILSARGAPPDLRMKPQTPANWHLGSSWRQRAAHELQSAPGASQISKIFRPTSNLIFKIFHNLFQTLFSNFQPQVRHHGGLDCVNHSRPARRPAIGESAMRYCTAIQCQKKKVYTSGKGSDTKKSKKV